MAPGACDESAELATPPSPEEGGECGCRRGTAWGTSASRDDDLLRFLFSGTCGVTTSEREGLDASSGVGWLEGAAAPSLQRGGRWAEGLC